jgi:hypothetical protein
MINREWHRLSATLIFVGFLFSVFVGLFHAEGASANDHPAVFAAYAASAIWASVHLGQFVGMAIILIGMLGMFFALDTHSLVNRLGSIAGGIALALYGVLQGVDGVALKQSVDAWASAPDVEKTSRFASAEAIRWLEWGIRSYQSVMLGLTLILLAVVIARTATSPTALAFLMGLSGVAFMMQGWVIGSEGFSPNNTIPTLSAYALILVWSTWLLIGSWRKHATSQIVKDKNNLTLNSG